MAATDFAERFGPEAMTALASTLPRVLPPGPLTVEEVRVADARLVADRLADDTEAGDPPAARRVWIPRADGSDLAIIVHGEPARDAMLWIHGGGMFLGSAASDGPLCARMAEELGVAVAAVEYRLAPEHRHPEPLHDCFTALRWLSERFDRVVVAGVSAGGGLAIGLAFLARDRGRPAIAGVHAYYPMIDDRPTESRLALADTEVWDARLDRIAWEAYLGDALADHYAAPSRATELAGLPPLRLDVAEFDLFRSEDETFGERAADAGVHVEMVSHAGAVHAFEFIAASARGVDELWDSRIDSMRRMLARGGPDDSAR